MTAPIFTLPPLSLAEEKLTASTGTPTPAESVAVAVATEVDLPSAVTVGWLRAMVRWELVPYWLMMAVPVWPVCSSVTTICGLPGEVPATTVAEALSKSPVSVGGVPWKVALAGPDARMPHSIWRNAWVVEPARTDTVAVREVWPSAGTNARDRVTWTVICEAVDANAWDTTFTPPAIAASRASPRMSHFRANMCTPSQFAGIQD